MQLAARWAQTPLEQVVALSNNGTLKWYQLAYDNPYETPFSIWDHRLQQFDIDMKIAPSSGEEKNGIVGASESENYRLLADALHGWTETLADINNTTAVSHR